MLKTHEREKLLNAIVFFVTNTNHCYKTKLYKLLYFLDFEHYAQVGRPVTGLRYYAWPKGPVPTRLHNEMESPAEDFERTLTVKKRRFALGKELVQISPNTPFDPSHFSKRELKILDDLATEFRNTKAGKMIEATHLENRPWHEIYEVRKAKQAEIPYEMAIRASEFNAVVRTANEESAVRKSYK